MTTITLTSRQLTILKALVEYASMSAGHGSNADEATQVFLQHIQRWMCEGASGYVADFVSTAREALKEQA